MADRSTALASAIWMGSNAASYVASAFALNDEALAGAVGEVLRVIRDAPGGVAYHLHFAEQLPGRVFQVAETLLDPAAGWIPAGEEEVEHDASLS